MAESYHNIKKLYIEACNKINMLEKEVKTIQGQYQNSLIRIKELRDDKS